VRLISDKFKALQSMRGFSQNFFREIFRNARVLKPTGSTDPTFLSNGFAVERILEFCDGGFTSVSVFGAKVFNKLGGIEESRQVFSLKANHQNL
jgi:hypothetical protein